MVNVNIGQWVTTCQALPADAPVTITAGELLALITAAGGLGATVTSSPDVGSAPPPTPPTSTDMSTV